jgi:hypothetical protein
MLPMVGYIKSRLRGIPRGEYLKVYVPSSEGLHPAAVKDQLYASRIESLGKTPKEQCQHHSAKFTREIHTSLKCAQSKTQWRGPSNVGTKGKTYPNLFPINARMFGLVDVAKGRRGVSRQKAVGTSAGLTVLIVARSDNRVGRMMKVRVVVHRVVSPAGPQSKLVPEDVVVKASSCPN